ncbi:MAG: hypothetical protein GYB31_06820 [Bacteroidetes bacterium]|nr:hypothetical protein [Bacteroidota bacterium]
MKYTFLLLALSGLFFSCGNNASTDQEHSDVPGDTLSLPENEEEKLLQQDAGPQSAIDPISLKGVETKISLATYFRQPGQIQRINHSDQIEVDLADSKETATVRIIGDIGFYEAVEVLTESGSYDLLLQAPTSVKATLRLRNDGYNKVAVIGEMNDWNANAGAMSLNNGIWEATFNLSPGTHNYLFVVDGKEMLDPKNPKKVSEGGKEYSQLNLRPPNAGGLPQIQVVSASGSQVEIALKNGGRLFAFWENQMLEVNQMDNKFLLAVPQAASNKAGSQLRLYAQNEYGVAKEVQLSLNAGILAE